MIKIGRKIFMAGKVRKRAADLNEACKLEHKAGYEKIRINFYHFKFNRLYELKELFERNHIF
jgi:hypothetical protein